MYLKFTCRETLVNEKQSPDGVAVQHAANFTLSEVGRVLDKREPTMVAWDKVNMEDPKNAFAGTLQVAIADADCLKTLKPGDSVTIELGR